MNSYSYKERGSYYQSRPQYQQQARRHDQEQAQYKTFETQLQPNEVRISSKGNSYAYSNVVLNIIKRDGYQHCKMVGRGRASEKALETMQVLKSREPNLLMEFNFTKSLNKSGEIVDEIHIMVQEKKQKAEPSYPQH